MIQTATSYIPYRFPVFLLFCFIIVSLQSKLLFNIIQILVRIFQILVRIFQTGSNAISEYFSIFSKLFFNDLGLFPQYSKQLPRNNCSSSSWDHRHAIRNEILAALARVIVLEIRLPIQNCLAGANLMDYSFYPWGLGAHLLVLGCTCQGSYFSVWGSLRLRAWAGACETA